MFSLKNVLIKRYCLFRMDTICNVTSPLLYYIIKLVRFYIYDNTYDIHQMLDNCYMYKRIQEMIILEGVNNLTKLRSIQNYSKYNCNV